MDMIQLCSGITHGRVLNGELYAQRVQKLIYLHLSIFIILLFIITSFTKGGYVFGSVGLSVCPLAINFVVRSLHHNFKHYFSYSLVPKMKRSCCRVCFCPNYDSSNSYGWIAVNDHHRHVSLEFHFEGTLLSTCL